jgi:hypothetical protein
MGSGERMSDTETLTAGYELNLLVAKKLGVPLELTHQRWLDILDKPGNTVCNYGRGIYMRCDGCGLNGYGNEVDWETPCPTPICKDYSTDIGAAWEVVEKVLSEDQWMRFDIFRALPNYPYRVQFGEHNCGWFGESKSIAHAIVLAFLALTDFEVKQ